MGRADRRQQRRNARELERRMRELDRLDAEFGLGALPGTTRPAWEPAAVPRRRSSGLLPGLVITVLLVGGLVAFSPGASFESLRQVLGIGLDRVSAAPTIPGGEGQFAFSLTQRDGTTPVGYDPCRPIEVEVSTTQAPEDWEEYVDTAIARTSEATGLRFEVLGTTEDRDFFTRRDGLLGDRPPVLVGWGVEDDFEGLAGDVAGLGGSTAVRQPGGRLHYVTGSVLLDASVFSRLDGGGEQRARAQAIVDHEFGHLVGLDHVEDPRELMHGEGVGVTGYGPGDLQGLARVGSIACR